MGHHQDLQLLPFGRYCYSPAEGSAITDAAGVILPAEMAVTPLAKETLGIVGIVVITESATEKARLITQNRLVSQLAVIIRAPAEGSTITDATCVSTAC